MYCDRCDESFKMQPDYSLGTTNLKATDLIYFSLAWKNVASFSNSHKSNPYLDEVATLISGNNLVSKLFYKKNSFLATMLPAILFNWSLNTCSEQCNFILSSRLLEQMTVP